MNALGVSPRRITPTPEQVTEKKTTLNSISLKPSVILHQAFAGGDGDELRAVVVLVDHDVLVRDPAASLFALP